MQNVNHQRAPIKSFTDLRAWQEGHRLVLMIYRTTDSFPKKEMFGLTSQLRRAAISITSNIAEGFSRASFREKIQFYSVALGSLTEVQNHVIVAKDVSYMESAAFEEIAGQCIIVSKILNGLIKKSKSFIRYS